MSTFLKFGITGGIGFVLDFLCTWFFKEKVHINPYLANAIGFSVAVINNFYLNKKWTFGNKSAETRKQFSLFLIFSLIGLGLNTLFLYLFTAAVFQFNFYLAKLLAIILVFLWNFTINSRVTFRK